MATHRCQVTMSLDSGLQIQESNEAPSCTDTGESVSVALFLQTKYVAMVAK